MSICFRYEIFLKSPLTTFRLFFSLCPDFVLLSYHSEGTVTEWKLHGRDLFMFPLQLSSFFKYWPLRKTYQRSAWRVSREMTFSIYFQLWATWSLPERRILEGTLLPSLPPSCPHSAGARCNNYIHLICIHPKPCSKKGEKLQATGNQIRKILWIATDNYSSKVTDNLYEVLLRLTVPALGFCRSSLDKVVIIVAEGLLLTSAYTECSLLS